MGYTQHKHKKMAGLLIAAGLFFSLVIAYTLKPHPPKTLEEYVERYGDSPIIFLAESGCYEDGVSMEITAPGLLPLDAFITYTMDGTDPGPDSQRYEDAVFLDPSAMELPETPGPDKTAPNAEDGAQYISDNPASGTRLYTVRARIICGDESTRVQSAVYGTGKGLLPCQAGYIISVDTDPVNLYDYDKGILVGGKELDKHDQSKYNGNYWKKGDKWVRPCHVAVFDREGHLIEERNAGISVSGGMSRNLEQKALNIAAGGDFGEEDGHFNLDIFSDAPDSELPHVGKYTHLRLRARSQMYRTFREKLVEQLALQSGFGCVVCSEPGIVFLNGSFYALAEIEPTFSNSYLAHRYNLPDTEHIEKNKGMESKVLPKMDAADLFAADLTEEKNRKALEAAVDMDNYLLYYAINIMDNNLDWPRNNVEAWRFTGEYDPDHPNTDGRLRFTLYDADKIYNTNETIIDTFGTDTFVSMMENILRGYESRFRDVMQAESYRSRMITILCDLMNTSFRTDNVLTLMKEDYAQNEDVFRAYYTSDFMDRISSDAASAPEQAEKRNAEVHADLEQYFGLSDQYDAKVSSSDGVCITWNNMYVGPGDEYECTYYTGVPVTYTASLSPGWRFDHWEINGKEVSADQDTESICLTIDGSKLKDGACNVRAVASPEEGELLIIAEVSAEGQDDWFRLYNAGTTKVRLGRYCVSDEAENLQKFRLPSETLMPGESCLITESIESTKDSLCSCGFGLRKGETLYLTPDSETQLTPDSMRIPYMSSNCSYGRKDNGALFRWFDNRGYVPQQ